MNDKYHPQNLKAGRLSVQPAKRSLHGIPSLAVANHRAPTIIEIKGKSWICDDLLLVLCSTVRSVVINH